MLRRKKHAEPLVTKVIRPCFHNWQPVRFLWCICYLLCVHWEATLVTLARYQTLYGTHTIVFPFCQALIFVLLVLHWLLHSRRSQSCRAVFFLSLADKRAKGGVFYLSAMSPQPWFEAWGKLPRTIPQEEVNHCLSRLAWHEANPESAIWFPRFQAPTNYNSYTSANFKTI